MKKTGFRKDTKNKILEAALKLFSKKGFLGATTKEIARQAGVTEVTLFRYFPSKEILFAEVINHYSFLPKLHKILEKIKKEEMPVEKSLSLIAKSFLEVLEVKKDLIRIMHAELVRYPDHIKKIYENTVENILRVLGDYFGFLIKKGVFKDIDQEVTARAFLGMFFSYFYAKEIKEILKSKKDDQENIIEIFIKIFLYGVIK